MSQTTRGVGRSGSMSFISSTTTCSCTQTTLTSASFTVGINLSTRRVTVWLRDKVNRPLGDSLPETRPTHELTLPLPYEITEMIIAHLTHDLDALKACSLTCRSWFIVAVPHIHHTLILGRGATPSGLKPLSEPHRQGLIPLVQEIRVEQWPGVATWFMPLAFNHHTLRSFSAFSNVHTLRLQRLEITRFIPHIGHYFGQFSPTLRSLILSEPYCTPLQLPYFLSFFPNLDDIGIRGNRTWHPIDIQDKNPISLPAPSLRGQLTLRGFPWAQTWAHLASCGGLRFRHMDLRLSVGCVPALLEACTKTLETLRFNATDRSHSKSFCMCLYTDSN